MKRSTVSKKAERLSCSSNKAAMIENMSESGISMITAPARTAPRFKPGLDVNLRLRPSNGKLIRLNC